MTLSDNAKAVIALTTRLGDPSRPSLSPGEWHRLSVALADAGLAPADLFRADLSVGGSATSALSVELADSVTVLLASASVATVAAGALGRKGIWIQTIADENYPAALSRLGSNAPPVLFGVGDRGLLDRGGVAIVGSRNVAELGARFAEAVASRAVELGHPVISGGARGVDQLAMNAAFRTEGGVVGVLADSLESRVRKPDVLQALDRGGVCLVTQQAPATGFSVGAAMARNKLIYALADLTVVVASDLDTGGTWAGAVEALKHGYGAVAVWRGDGEGSGNSALEHRGAAAITTPDHLDKLLGNPRQLSDAGALEQLSILDPGPTSGR